MDEINKRLGTDFKTQSIRLRNVGVHSSSKCGSDALRTYFNETTLFHIASQYAADVLRLGYL
jgi:hypothetical protein